MVKPDEALEIELTNGLMQQTDGENPPPLKARLEIHLDDRLASRIFRSAFSLYSAAKESGLVVLMLG
jgi:hypothetical protein